MVDGGENNALGVSTNGDSALSAGDAVDPINVIIDKLTRCATIVDIRVISKSR